MGAGDGKVVGAGADLMSVSESVKSRIVGPERKQKPNDSALDTTKELSMFVHPSRMTNRCRTIDVDVLLLQSMNYNRCRTLAAHQTVTQSRDCPFLCQTSSSRGFSVLPKHSFSNRPTNHR